MLIKAPYCKTTDELKERWRKQVKLSTLASLVEKQKIQEEIADGEVFACFVKQENGDFNRNKIRITTKNQIFMINLKEIVEDFIIIKYIKLMIQMLIQYIIKLIKDVISYCQQY